MADNQQQPSPTKQGAYTQSQLELIATAAIASVPANGMTMEAWEKAVIRRAATIQKMRFLQEGSPLMNVLDSVKIKATIDSVEYEEKSQRHIITYRPANHPDKPEQIRTPRIDSREGKMIANDIKKVASLAGTKSNVIIFKHNEMPSEERVAAARANNEMVPTQGYRQAVWFDFE